LSGAAPARHVSPIPFPKPTGSVRVGRVNNEFVAMPTVSQMEHSDLDLIVAGTRDAITMIEGFSCEMPEVAMLQAILYGHEQIRKIIDLIEELRTRAGLEAKVYPLPPEVNPAKEFLKQKFGAEFRELKQTSGKLA